MQVISLSAVLLDTPISVQYFRQLLASIAEQDEAVTRLYFAISGRYANSVDVANERAVVVRGEKFSQFEGYSRLVARLRADFDAEALEHTWLLFSDGDDLWNRQRWTTVRKCIEAAQDSVWAICIDGLVQNDDRCEGPSFCCADDVDRGLVANTIRRRHCHQRGRVEYVNFVPKFVVLERFILEFRPFLHVSVIDCAFDRFIRTYGGTAGRTLWATPELWEYFYRQHGDSLTLRMDWSSDHVTGIIRLTRLADMMCVSFSHVSSVSRQEATALLDSVDSKSLSSDNKKIIRNRIQWWISQATSYAETNPGFIAHLRAISLMPFK